MGKKKMKKIWETHFTKEQLKEVRDCCKLVGKAGDNGGEGYIALIAKMAGLLDGGLIPFVLDKSKIDIKQPVIPNKPKSVA